MRVMSLIKPNIIGFVCRIYSDWSYFLMAENLTFQLSKILDLLVCIYMYTIDVTLVCYLFIAYDRSYDAVQSYKSFANHLCIIFGHFYTLFIRI